MIKVDTGAAMHTGVEHLRQARMRDPTRRRLLQITAGMAAMGIGPAVPKDRHYRWTGSALGAAAAIDLYHADRARATRLIEQVVAEVDRLEGIFSLQRRDSALSRLNRDGRLARPPLELLSVLETATLFAQLSDGAFDVTVQPLWYLHAEAAARGAVPDQGSVERSLARVGWRWLELDRGVLAFRRAGMAATLNGIAQGYITDRVTDLLRDACVEEVLVDLGELRAGGAGQPGRSWRLATAFGPVQLADRALAVSSARPADCCLPGGSPNLISPTSGMPVLDGRTVVVTAPSAMLADAAATALATSPPDGDLPLEPRLAPFGISVLRQTA